MIHFHPEYVVDENLNKQKVMIPINEWREILKKLEESAQIDNEITIMSEATKKNRKLMATNFVNKWAGFLENVDTDASKDKYLTEKYK